MKSMKSPETDGFPEVGALVRDAGGRIGRLMAYTRARAWLRPPGGGREWDVDPESITTVSDRNAPGDLPGNAPGDIPDQTPDPGKGDPATAC